MPDDLILPPLGIAVANLLQRVAPHAKETYRQGLSPNMLDRQLPAAGLDRRGRLNQFLAQVLHETGGLTVLSENLNYTTPKRLVAVWPSRFTTEPDPEDRAGKAYAPDYVRQPERLANLVYMGRMGNQEPGDGWRYRGRGLLQLTGRDAYQEVGKRASLNLVDYPDRAADPGHVLKIAIAMWQWKRCDVPADRGDIATVSLRINGSTDTVAERAAWLNKIEQAWN